jgi:hypothetical protein
MIGIRELQKSNKSEYFKSMSDESLKSIFYRFNANERFSFASFKNIIMNTENDGIAITCVKPLFGSNYKHMDYTDDILYLVKDVQELSILIVGDKSDMTILGLNNNGAQCSGVSFDEFMENNYSVDVIVSLYIIQSIDKMRDFIDKISDSTSNVIIIDFDVNNETKDIVNFYKRLTEGIFDDKKKSQTIVTNNWKTIEDRFNRYGFKQSSIMGLKEFRSFISVLVLV